MEEKGSEKERERDEHAKSISYFHLKRKQKINERKKEEISYRNSWKRPSKENGSRRRKRVEK